MQILPFAIEDANEKLADVRCESVLSENFSDCLDKFTLEAAETEIIDETIPDVSQPKSIKRKARAADAEEINPMAAAWAFLIRPAEPAEIKKIEINLDEIREPDLFILDIDQLDIDQIEPPPEAFVKSKNEGFVRSLADRVSHLLEKPETEAQAVEPKIETEPQIPKPELEDIAAIEPASANSDDDRQEVKRSLGQVTLPHREAAKILSPEAIVNYESKPQESFGQTAQVSEKAYNPAHVARQIIQDVQAVSAASFNEFNEIKIALRPESLGEVTLKVLTENGLITAQFTAENQKVKEIIEANFNTLRDSLTQQGLDISQLSVNVGGDSGAADQQPPERDFTSAMPRPHRKKVIDDMPYEQILDGARMNYRI